MAQAGRCWAAWEGGVANGTRGKGQGDATLQTGKGTEANTRDSLKTITPAGLKDVISYGFYLLPFVVPSSTGAASCLFSSCRGLYLPGNLQQGQHRPIIHSSYFYPSHRNVELISRGRECISELKHAFTLEKKREGFLLLLPANVSCVESLCH